MQKPPSTDELKRSEAMAFLEEADISPSWSSFEKPAAAGSEAMPIPERIGRYRMLGRLGIGGMAEVLLAEQSGPRGFAKKVVIKRLLPHLAIDAKFVELFLREARIAAKLAHPNVVQVYELGEEHGRYFIAMEYVDGLTLYQLAKRLWGANKALPLEVSMRAVADAALGLHHAHELRADDGSPLGVVHRDISPDNLIVTREGVTKVLDFGIAKPSSESMTRTGELKGKIPFMAPELLGGLNTLDRRADLYSLGVSLYWLLTGKRPFHGESDFATIDLALRSEARPPSAWVATVPPEIDEIVMALLEKNPADRIQTGAELHRLLSSSLAVDTALSQCVVEQALTLPERALHQVEEPCDAPISTLGTLSSPTPPTPSSRSRFAPVAVMLAAVVVIGGGFAALALTQPTDDTSIAAAHAPTPARVPAAPLPSVDPAPPAPAQSASSVAKDDRDDDASDAGAKPVTVTLKAPARIMWRTARGVDLGHGAVTASLPAGSRTVIAFDPLRQATTRVPIARVVDYDKLPRGTLEVRAFPFADVFVGNEKLGTTPLPSRELVAGTYKVKLVYEGNVVMKTVDVTPGKIERVAAKMVE